MPCRALIAAALLAAAGCAQPVAQAVAQPEPPAPPPVVDEVILPKKAADPAPADDPEPDLTPPAVSALTGRINLPKDGGRWPWKLAPAPAAVDGKGVKVTFSEGRMFLAVSPESGRFVLAAHLDRRDAKNAQTLVTRVVLGDVKTGKLLGEWEVKDQFIPLDVSPDGTRFVAKSSWPDSKLTVGTIGADGELSRKTLIAHDRLTMSPSETAREADLQIAWAGFAGNDRVVSAADGGQVRVFNAATVAKIGTLDGTPKLTPCLTPDRKQLIAHAGGKVVLIDPADCQALGTRPFALPSGVKHFAVSPDGATLACAKADRVRFLDLKTGQVWDQVMPRFGEPANFAAHFSWAGSFLVCERNVYDPGLSFPVWQHARGEAEAYTPRQTWAAVRTTPPFQPKGAKVEGVVRPFSIIPPDLAGIAAAGKGRPNMYVLPPASAVKVDVSKLPPGKQAAAKAELEHRLWEIGYRTDPAAAPVASLTLDPAVTKNTAYANLTNVPYTHQPLRLQLRHDGKVLYEHAQAKEPPAFIVISGGMTLAQKVAAEGYGQPHYDWLKTAAVPPDFRGPGFPAFGFGQTHLQADGPRYAQGR